MKYFNKKQLYNTKQKKHKKRLQKCLFIAKKNNSVIDIYFFGLSKNFSFNYLKKQFFILLRTY